MENGSIASINIQTKPSGKKSMLAINLDKLESSAEVEVASDGERRADDDDSRDTCNNKAIDNI
ncbi:MAG: hypothetical protein KDA17_02480 [Candidatus Saccharibacteria bacterium]|nr:hypothetical protein [Candidatus Saccharibacteria bacterium]MCA9336822.1 hypothetical protein [Candidatus Saccharibacteria bacterium]MCA9339755.1 hypothetical protein [Candidatus Saccharibacteria bacterium]HPQ82129.1 hypothetical protein [Candidatus Saccharimonas sp.]